MHITPELVRHLERLAALRLSAEARTRMCADLERIVDYVRQLEGLGALDVEPTRHGTATPPQRLRPDAVQASLPRDAILANAPERRDGFYCVPRFVGADTAREDGDS